MPEPKPKPFPVVTPELIEKLNQLYPEQCPDPKWDDRTIWMRAGERRVVRKLIQEFETQQKDRVLHVQ